MSADSVLIGIGLVVVLGVGAQLLAGALRVPSIVLLLPAGFLAGIATTTSSPTSCSATCSSRWSASASASSCSRPACA